MQSHYTKYTNMLIASVLDSPGETSADLRHRVETRAARLGGRAPQEIEPVPEHLADYVKKVALYAYRVTDEDVEALRAIGYSEDAIFELTVSIALGAGLARLERGLAALKGVEDATQNT